MKNEEQEVNIWEEDVSDEVSSTSDSYISSASNSGIGTYTELDIQLYEGEGEHIQGDTAIDEDQPLLETLSLLKTETDPEEQKKKLNEFMELFEYMQRESEYGSEVSQLSEEDKLTYEYQKRMAELKGEIEETEVSPGVTQKTFGDYIETTIELYGGKTYDDLSEIEQAKIDAWKADCKVAELEGTEAPECPYELTTETRVKANASKLLDELKLNILTPEELEELEKTQAAQEREDKYGEILESPETDTYQNPLAFMEGLDSTEDLVQHEPAVKDPLHQYHDGEVANVTSPEEGVTQIQYEDGYVVTTCKLYDGKTYEQLSDEDKAAIDEWKEEYKEWQEECKRNATLLDSSYEFPDPPECPLEQTTETRGKQGEVPETKTYKNPLILDMGWGEKVDIDTLMDYTTE